MSVMLDENNAGIIAGTCDALPPPTSVGSARAAQFDSKAAVHVLGLTVVYHDKPVLFSVDVHIKAGSMTAILGPNGAGKSTLLKTALGLLRPLCGQIRIYNETIKKARARVAYVPQRASVDWEFPARALDVVLMGLYPMRQWFYPLTKQHRARALDALDRVGMADFANRQIGALSGGQQQRVFFARALVQKPRLYLLDEPFAGVDAATERVMVDVLHELVQQDCTVVAVHHDLANVRDYFDRAILLNVRVIASGALAHVLTDAHVHRTYAGALSVAYRQAMSLS